MSDTPRTTTIINLGVDGEKYRTLERELAAMTKERDELLAENARIKMNHGCARNQRTTQFCAEAVAIAKERDELKQHADALADALSWYHLSQKTEGTLAAYRASQQAKP